MALELFCVCLALPHVRMIRARPEWHNTECHSSLRQEWHNTFFYSSLRLEWHNTGTFFHCSLRPEWHNTECHSSLRPERHNTGCLSYGTKPCFTLLCDIVSHFSDSFFLTIIRRVFVVL